MSWRLCGLVLVLSLGLSGCPDDDPFPGGPDGSVDATTDVSQGDSNVLDSSPGDTNPSDTNTVDATMDSGPPPLDSGPPPPPEAGPDTRDVSVPDGMVTNPAETCIGHVDRGSASPPAGAACGAEAESDLAGLTPAQLVTYLQSTEYDCMYYLWTFSGNVQASLTDDAKMMAALSAISSGAATTGASDANNLRELLYFVRIHWYNRFYNASSFGGSDATALRTATQAALQAIADNVDWNAGEGSALIGEGFAQVADGAELVHVFTDEFAEIIQAYKTYPSTAYQDRALFAALASIARLVGNGDEALLAAVDDTLVDALEALILESCDREWLINNALWALGSLAKAPALNERVTSLLTMFLDRYERLSPPWLWIVRGLDQFNMCRTADPAVMLCRADVAAELEMTIFPNRFEFDGGDIVFETSLSRETIERLYPALAEVRANLFRLLEGDDPVADDPSPVAIFKIYGTKGEYEQYHPFLYNLGTNNGGIYIEQDSTLYTYERTPAESIYSLEELVRHEYVHYLLGRYGVVGLWGEHAIYSGGRMVFFDEGIGEFLAWSTSRDGVKVRKRLVQNIMSDGSRMTVAEFLRSSYASGFRFYNYGGLFFHYLYASDIASLQQLLQLGRAGDAAGVDAWISSRSSDPGLESAYQAYIDAQIAMIGSLDDVSSPFAARADLAVADVSAVQAAFQATRLGGGTACEAAGAGMGGGMAGFRCTGSVQTSLSPTLSQHDAWNGLDLSLREILGELAPMANNYELTNCWFEDSQILDSGGQKYASASYVCEGPLR